PGLSTRSLHDALPISRPVCSRSATATSAPASSPSTAACGCRLESPAVRVLVTGGYGFIGSHVVAALLAAGHEPVCAVRRVRMGRSEEHTSELQSRENI